MTRGPKKRLIDRTVDEAMEALSATQHALRHWERALADRIVTFEEALEGLRLTRVALAESQDVVRMAERANERQKIGHLYAEFEDYDIPAHALANAATIDVFPPTMDAPEAA